MCAEVKMKIGNEFAMLLCFSELINAVNKASITFGGGACCTKCFSVWRKFKLRISICEPNEWVFVWVSSQWYLDVLVLINVCRRLNTNNIADIHIYWLCPVKYGDLTNNCMDSQGLSCLSKRAQRVNGIFSSSRFFFTLYLASLLVRCHSTCNVISSMSLQCMMCIDHHFITLENAKIK